MNCLSCFAENPFPATPGPETPRNNSFFIFCKNSKLITTCVESIMPAVPLSVGLQHGLRNAEVEAHDPDAHAIHHMVRGDAAHRLSSTVAIRLESFPRGSGGIIRQPPKGHREPRAQVWPGSAHWGLRGRAWVSRNGCETAGMKATRRTQHCRNKNSRRIRPPRRA